MYSVTNTIRDRDLYTYGVLDGLPLPYQYQSLHFHSPWDPDFRRDPMPSWSGWNPLPFTPRSEYRDVV